MIRPFAFLVVFVAASACGSSSPGGGAADGGDVSVGDGDASLGDGDGSGDGEADGEAHWGCATPVAAFCASGPPPGKTCVPALSPADLETACAFGAPYSLVKSCGGFDELILSGVDSGVIQYFDPTTEKLVAIVQYLDLSFFTCLGGPPDFVVPSCPDATWQRACPLFDGSISKSGPADANDGSPGDAEGMDP